MRKALLIVFLLLAAISGAARADAQIPPYRIIVYAPQYNHSGDQELNRLFGDDLKRHWPENVLELRRFPGGFVGAGEKISAEIAALAEDPLLRAVVIGEGLPGTLEGITRLRVSRPDIFVVVIDPHEDLETTTRVATLTVTINSAARGYIFPVMAARMGADTLVYFSIPRHQEVSYIARQRRILSAVCRDMGINMVVDLSGPDPALKSRGENKAYFEAAVGAYLEKYGHSTAFMATGTVHNDLLIPIVMEKGGHMLEALQSSTLLGFPEALGLSREARSLFGRWHDLLTLEDERYMEMGPKSNFTVWAYPYPHTVVLSMVDIVAGALEGRGDIYDLRLVSRALGKYSPGVKWLVSTIMNYETNSVLPQAVLVLQDSYWLGHGYQGFTRINIPTRYYRIQ